MINYLVFALKDMLDQGTEQENIINSFKKFSCQKEKDLENFLVNKAIEWENIDYGRTYLMIDGERDRIAGFFTISLKSVDLGNLPGKRRRKLLKSTPGRDGLKSYPAFLIGQIGRCDKYSSEDLPGKIILSECYSAFKNVHNIIGGNIIVLQCREYMYEKFYKEHEFAKLEDNIDSDGLLTLYKREF